jgi:hypothetical protein
MKKPLHSVSDRAVIRYLERVEGMDIESIRRKIGHTVDRGIEQGAIGVVVGGVVYKLVEGVVSTVWIKNQPNKHTHRGRKKGRN